MNGFLLIDKPIGMTSFDVIRQLKKVLPKKIKIGHAGTLDPFASGLLIVLLGHGTRFMEDLCSRKKSYLAILKLGLKSNTLDIDGEIENVPNCSDLDLSLANHFLGEISQKPPMYSALKKNGVPLYSLARKGIELDIEPRKVTIFDLKLKKISETEVQIETTVSSGTYIRVLAFDLCAQSNTSGILTELRRTTCGGFQIDQSLDLESTIENLKNQKVSSNFFPVENAFELTEVSQEVKDKLYLGQQTILSSFDFKEETVYLSHQNQLFGVIKKSQNQFKIRHLIPQNTL